MNITVQCPACGIVLNVPPAAAGRRLKCPQCQTKFAAPAGGPGDSIVAEAGPISGMYAPVREGNSTLELPLLTAKGDARSGHSTGRTTAELPTNPGPLRDTLDLAMLADPAPSRKAPGAAATVSDAMSLFDDEPKSSRKPSAAEARMKARRCPTCSTVVPPGMSLCATCGLDLDTGRRVEVADVFEDDLPPAMHAPTPPIGLVFIGTLCITGFAILCLASLVAWNKGLDGAQYLLLVWAFGIYGAVQFLRRKSIRPLVVALSLAAAVGSVYLIALPVYYANMPVDAPAVEPGPGPGDPDMPDIKPIVVDLTKVSWGVFSLLLYAGVTLYLNTPGLRRQFARG